MALELSGNTIVIESGDAGATELTAQIYGKQTRVYVKSIRWIAPSAAAGHSAVVTDADGRRVWKADATGSHYSESELVERWIQGLIVPTLSSGELNITLG
jgi:hypothetical protein